MSQTYSTRQRPSGGQVYSSRPGAHTTAPGPVVTAGVPRVTVPVSAVPQTPGAVADLSQLQGLLQQLQGAVPGLQAQGVSPQIQAAVAPPAPEQQLTFALSCQGLPAAQRHCPQATGQVSVRGRAGGPGTVQAGFTGLTPPRDPASRPTLWLIHDLRVPADLAPADLALLPRAVPGANMPGAVFTVDGKAPTSGWTVLQQEELAPQ